MNSVEIGDFSVGAVIKAFLQRGWVVLTPFSNGLRYDLVINRGQGFERVQVKTGRLKDNNSIVRFHPRSINYCRVTRATEPRDYRGQIEFFAVYCPDNDRTYLVPVEDVGLRQASLRLLKPKNNQADGVTFAKDYEL